MKKCPTCDGDGYTNEGDPEIGNALFDCTTCGGIGRIPEGAVPTVPAVAVASAVSRAQMPADEFVRMLLWDDFPECCGCPVEDTGGEYMGQRETVMACCGRPEPARLTDAQIVASLRERFPETLVEQAMREQAEDMQRRAEDDENAQQLSDFDSGPMSDCGDA